MAIDEEDLTRVERYILDFLHETNAILSPKCIAVNIGPPNGYNPSYIGERCRKLTEKDLLEKSHKSMYRLTPKGRKLAEQSKTPKFDR